MITIRLTCPKHRRYNPEREGQGGIRGGCEWCGTIYAEWKRLTRMVRDWKVAHDDSH